MLASVKIVPETDRTTRPTQLESFSSVSCVMDASYARLARAVLVDISDDEVAGRFLLSSRGAWLNWQIHIIDPFH